MWNQVFEKAIGGGTEGPLAVVATLVLADRLDQRVPIRPFQPVGIEKRQPAPTEDGFQGSNM
jgi:hypothetical protein